MRISICDDDALIIAQLEKYIHAFFKKIKVSTPEIVTYSSGDALLKDNQKLDLVFLDVEMPGVDGIFVGNTLKKRQPNCIIIIVTSFSEYLDEAMRFHVFRYLSKPIEKARLFRNLKDALQLYNTSDGKISVETKDGSYTISLSDIICVEAQARQVIVHTPNQDFYSTHAMQYWIDTLKQPCFIQTHRSFIVNMAHVCNHDNATIRLYNYQFQAYLTRRKYKEFKTAYLLYLESMR